MLSQLSYIPTQGISFIAYLLSLSLSLSVSVSVSLSLSLSLCLCLSVSASLSLSVSVSVSLERGLESSIYLPVSGKFLQLFVAGMTRTTRL